MVGGNAGRTPANSGNQTLDPYPISVAWPGSVVKAYLNWNYLSYAPGNLDEATVYLNGVGVTPGWISASTTGDLCWGRSYTVGYTADVTGIVSAAGPGVFSLGSAVDEVAVGALAEGASLLVVYDDGGPARAVHVYNGETIVNTYLGTAPGVMADWLNPYPGGYAHFFINALDGQDIFGDSFVINGAVVDGVLPGTWMPGNAWAGLLGPGPAGGGIVQYDHGEGDTSPWMIPGDTSLGFLTAAVDDCAGHTFGALSFAPEPASLLMLGLALVVARRRH